MNTIIITITSFIVLFFLLKLIKISIIFIIKISNKVIFRKHLKEIKIGVENNRLFLQMLQEETNRD